MKRAVITFLVTAALLALLLIPSLLAPIETHTAQAKGVETPVAAEQAQKTAFSGSVVLYVGSPEALVKGEKTSIDDNPAVVPFIENSRTLMPLAFVARTLGFSVEWQEATRSVTLKQQGLTLEFKLGSPIMKNNGASVEMETAALAQNGRTFVPISYVAKAMSLNVTYDRGLIILDSEKTYSLSEDAEYINALIDQLSGLPTVGSAENFNALMKDIAAEQNEAVRKGELWGWEVAEDDVFPMIQMEAVPVTDENAQVSPETPAMGLANRAEGDADGVDHSTTNIQVAGVDEADIVKTDGSHIYHLADGALNIIQADGRGQMKLLCAIDLQYKQTGRQNGFYPQDMYVDGNYLCVIGSEYVYGQDNSARYLGKDFVTAYVYDISDKAAPLLTREFSAEGSLLTSRKVDNTLYLVINHYMSFYGYIEPCEAAPLYRDSSVAKDDELIPLNFGAMRYFPGQEDSSMLVICGLNLTDAQAEAKITSILGSGNTVYMSRSALYIAKHNYSYRSFFWRELVEDRVVGGDSDNTTFFKFALDDGYAIYQAKGTANGNVLNQYSMDEFDGCFRVAMTVQPYLEESKNALVIFDRSMQLIGSIEDMAPGERVYSARFMGERAFMVTYRTVDPLFTLDLSDPHHPRVLGELKIPGYSTYLHPYDENHLIGFGRDTEEYKTIDSKGNVVSERAVNKGLKLALFDISDLSDPKEISVVSIGDESTSSELLYNPKALLFSKEKGIFAFPVSHYSYRAEDKEYADLNGAHVYDISPAGIKLRGVISPAGIDKNDPKSWYYDGNIQRILYIGDTFYSASNWGMQANNMAGLQYIGAVRYGK